MPVSNPELRRILTVAAWFGIVTGLIEGIIFLLLRMDVTVEIIWIAAFLDLLLFIVIGFTVAALARLFPILPTMRVSVGLFSLITLLNWLGLALAERISIYAIVLIATGIAVQFTRWFSKREKPVMAFWRMTLPWFGALSLLFFIGIKGGLWWREYTATSNLPLASQEAPNVLVMVIDTLRADHLSSYGYSRTTSPNIDRIAQEGVLFENAFSSSSYTLPSHASMLTGRHPFEHEAEWSKRAALANSPYNTLPEVLRSMGYRSGGFSANLFWFTRQYGFDRGFTHFEDFFQSNSDMVLRTFYGRVFETFVMRRLGYLDIPARVTSYDINNSLLRWIERDPDRPFFAFVNYMDTHDPYLPPAPFRNKFSALEKPGGKLNWRIGLDDPQLTPEELQGEIDAYDGAIAYVDQQIGELLHELQKRGLLQKTLIVITSDHGESFGEHNLFLHGHSLYRETIHVPLIFWQPGKVPAGIRVSKPVGNVALASTVLELTGGKDQKIFPGPSLARHWTHDESDTTWPYPLSELSRQDWVSSKFPVYHGSMKSVVSEQWHYITNETLGVELYDWKNDPLELNNMKENQETQGVLTYFQQKLFNGLLSYSNSKDQAKGKGTD